MSGYLRLCLCAALALIGLGCSSESVRTVWIADAHTETGGTASPGMRVQLVGKGFGHVQVLEDSCRLEALADAGGQPAQPLPFPHAVTLGDVAAPVFSRRDDCLVLEVPEVQPGPHFIVVWTGGVASNAFPITVAE